MSKQIMVVNNQPHLVFFGTTCLRPGVNSVSESVAKDIAKHPHTKNLVGVAKVEIAKGPPSTKELNIDEAKALVGKTNDPDLLHKYQSEDARPAVAKAIVEKREDIGPTEEKK